MLLPKSLLPLPTARDRSSRVYGLVSTKSSFLLLLMALSDSARSVGRADGKSTMVKNRDASNGPLARPLARLLAPLTNLLAILLSYPACFTRAHLFACTHSSSLKLVGKRKIRCRDFRLFWTIAKSHFQETAKTAKPQMRTKSIYELHRMRLIVMKG